jgi:hypothetical protein
MEEENKASPATVTPSLSLVHTLLSPCGQSQTIQVHASATEQDHLMAAVPSFDTVKLLFETGNAGAIAASITTTTAATAAAAPPDKTQTSIGSLVNESLRVASGKPSAVSNAAGLAGRKYDTPTPGKPPVSSPPVLSRAARAVGGVGQWKMHRRVESEDESDNSGINGAKVNSHVGTLSSTKRLRFIDPLVVAAEAALAGADALLARCGGGGVCVGVGVGGVQEEEPVVGAGQHKQLSNESKSQQESVNSNSQPIVLKRLCLGNASTRTAYFAQERNHSPCVDRDDDDDDSGVYDRHRSEERGGDDDDDFASKRGSRRRSGGRKGNGRFMVSGMDFIEDQASVCGLESEDDEEDDDDDEDDLSGFIDNRSQFTPPDVRKTGERSTQDELSASQSSVVHMHAVYHQSLIDDSQSPALMKRMRRSGLSAPILERELQRTKSRGHRGAKIIKQEREEEEEGEEYINNRTLIVIDDGDDDEKDEEDEELGSVNDSQGLNKRTVKALNNKIEGNTQQQAALSNSFGLCLTSLIKHPTVPRPILATTPLQHVLMQRDMQEQQEKELHLQAQKQQSEFLGFQAVVANVRSGTVHDQSVKDRIAENKRKALEKLRQRRAGAVVTTGFQSRQHQQHLHRPNVSQAVASLPCHQEKAYHPPTRLCQTRTLSQEQQQQQQQQQQQTQRQQQKQSQYKDHQQQNQQHHRNPLRIVGGGGVRVTSPSPRSSPAVATATAPAANGLSFGVASGDGDAIIGVSSGGGGGGEVAIREETRKRCVQSSDNWPTTD